MTNYKNHLAELLALIQKADAAIMDIYRAHSAVVTVKADNSPLTQADMASHRILVTGMAALFPDVPLISEEGDEHANKKIVQQTSFWLVDPIDGTREFLNRSGDFTVCVGLIEGNVPVFGIISVPARGVVYYGGPDMGSYKKQDGHEAVAIHVSPKKLGVVLASRSHPDGATAQYIADHYPDATIQRVGSQLKLPYIAEGLADAYPRLGSTMHHWDLAAGHAILAGAGGKVSRPDGSAVDYHDPSLQIGDFIATL